MRNITINGTKENSKLDRAVILDRGALVLLKYNDRIVNVFMVVSIKYNKNVLVNLDDGVFPSGKTCYRKMTVREILNCLVRTGYDGYDIEVYAPNTYKLDVLL